MLLDAIKIERNYFYDTVQHDTKGLCLTWNEFAEIPLSGINVRQGTVEMWVKLYTDTRGVDHYNKEASRTLFTLVNNLDDSISLSIKTGNWFEIGYGNTKSGYKVINIDSSLYDLTNHSFSIGDIFHIALVWENSGTEMDGADTIRLYINGDFCIASRTTWEVLDNKGALFRLGGGNTYLAGNNDDDGAAIFGDVKVYNFCKTEFDLNYTGSKDAEKLTPNSLVQLSPDDVNFYNNTSIELPLIYESVQPGQKVVVYTKVDKTKMDLLDKLTGTITVDWEVPV